MIRRAQLRTRWTQAQKRYFREEDRQRELRAQLRASVEAMKAAHAEPEPSDDDVIAGLIEDAQRGEYGS